DRLLSRRQSLLLAPVSAAAVLSTGWSAPRLPAAATALPAVQVSGVRRAFWNGEHNAFTDLCWFRNRIWLTFRSCPDGHMVHPTSCIIVLCSEDLGVTWKEMHRFSVPLR
ncbi:MAG: hypothetical protein ACK6D6_00740, partial [Planctomyces sp.]